MSKGWSDICSLSTWFRLSLLMTVSRHPISYMTSYFSPMVYFCNIQSKNCIISSHLTSKLIQQIFYLILEVKNKSEGQSTVKPRDSTGLGYLKTKLKGEESLWKMSTTPSSLSSFYSLYPTSISNSNTELPSPLGFALPSSAFLLDYLCSTFRSQARFRKAFRSLPMWSRT